MKFPLYRKTENGEFIRLDSLTKAFVIILEDNRYRGCIVDDALQGTRILKMLQADRITEKEFDAAYKQVLTELDLHYSDTKSKQKVSTLNGVKSTYIRADGNTTRCIDNAIQLLFQGVIIKVEDPWENGTHHKANENLFDRICRRLQAEHGRYPVMNKREASNMSASCFAVDRNKLEIELLR